MYVVTIIVIVIYYYCSSPFFLIIIVGRECHFLGRFQRAVPNWVSKGEQVAHIGLYLLDTIFTFSCLSLIHLCDKVFLSLPP